MPQRPPRREAAPAEDLTNLCLGYNGYTDPNLTNPKMWAAATNVFAGTFGYLQRARFANLSVNGGTGKPFTSLKYFAVPGLSSYLLADINNKLLAFDTQTNPYPAFTRINNYVDPANNGSPLLAGPWSREVLQSIAYEMNGQIKQTGRGVFASIIESFGLDTPDTSPQVVINAGTQFTISAAPTGASRAANTVTITTTAPHGYTVGTWVNILGVTDATFIGTFQILTVPTSTTFTFFQLGQGTIATPSTSGSGTVDTKITKAVGRSYAYAWENANKAHVGAPSPATQYILYAAQNGQIQCVEAGAITWVANATAVVGTGTFFTSAWIGRSIWSGGNTARIVAVADATHLTVDIGLPGGGSNAVFQVYDISATHIRLYMTADGGATYFRTYRQAWNPLGTTLVTSGLQFNDTANSEPPALPFTTEVAQNNNVPPPVGAFLNEYQGRLVVFGVPGAPQSFFYSNVEATTVGLQQESFAPLNQVTLPIQNASMNGMIEFPGSAIIWSDRQDMFRLTGLLTDNVVSATPAQQGASIARLPYNLGCASPFATAITPLGGIWLTPNAEVWLYTDRYAPRNIGRSVQDILNSISPAALKLARATYYHTNTRNWFVLNVAANGSTFNNTTLILDLDLLASNGSPSYFTFDMASNSPSWYVFNPIGLNSQPRCDSLEVVYEQGGGVRLFVGQVDNIQDIDFDGSPNGGYGTEIVVPNAGVTLHAWGNDSAVTIKHPGWIRFNTNRDPSMLQTDGWTFAVQGIDDDFYTFESPLSLALVPGVNDTSTFGGNPDFLGGLAFRHSPDLYRIGGVNFVMGRRLKFQINFPSGIGINYRLRGVSFGFGALPSS